MSEVDGTSIVRRPPFGNNPLVGERGTDTQRRILEAALEVFSEVGFHGARVELITKRTGCSRPAFYQYFSSKDDVFWKLAGQLGHAMVGLGERLGTITPDERGVATLSEWLRAFADLYDEYAPVFSEFQAAIRDHDSLAQGSGTIRDRLGDALVRSFGARHPSLETDTLATGIVTMVVRCNFYWRNQDQPVDRDRCIDGLAAVVHRLLAGPTPGVNVRSTGVPPPRRRSRRWPESPDAQPGRTLRQRGEKTRRRLLDAGAVVLPVHGYHATRVDDIVAAAGVSHGSFYRYFENKDDFFRVLIEQASAEMTELIDDFPESVDTEPLRRWLQAWFATYRTNGGVISTWQEMKSPDPDLDTFSKQIAASVVERLIQILGRRRFGDPLVDSLAFLALIERLPYSVITLGYAEEPDVIDAMLIIIRQGFMGIDELAAASA